MMRTTVTLSRLRRAGYRSFSEIYQNVSPVLENRLIPNGTQGGVRASPTAI